MRPRTRVVAADQSPSGAANWRLDAAKSPNGHRGASGNPKSSRRTDAVRRSAIIRWNRWRVPPHARWGEIKMTKSFTKPMSRLGFLVSIAFTVMLVLTSSGVRADSVEQHQQASQAAFSRGDLDAAEAEARLSLEEAERRFGPDDPRTGQSLMWLAIVYQAKGRPEEAQRAGERVLAICEKTFGPDHLETAAVMSMLASFDLAAGDLAKAESLLRRSVAIKEKGFGPNHPDTAVSSSYLADILVEKGEYVEAKGSTSAPWRLRRKRGRQPTHPFQSRIERSHQR